MCMGNEFIVASVSNTYDATRAFEYQSIAFLDFQLELLLRRGFANMNIDHSLTPPRAPSRHHPFGKAKSSLTKAGAITCSQS